MKIKLEQLRGPLIRMLEEIMEGTHDCGYIAIDKNGCFLPPGAKGKDSWQYKFLEAKCTDDSFQLKINPTLRFKKTINLMADDIPDTVPEAVDYLSDWIAEGAAEYEECFANDPNR